MTSIYVTMGTVSTVAERPVGAEEPAFPDLVGEAPPSPAGPIEPAEAAALPEPPVDPLPRAAADAALQPAPDRVSSSALAARASARSSACVRPMPGGPVVTSHPDHVRSLFTAKPEQAPSLTGESPLRPIVGTRLGPDRGRRRATCASANCCCRPSTARRSSATRQMIADGRRTRDRHAGRSTAPFALAPRMQAITLDVIMAGIFGIEGRPERGTPEHRLRITVKHLVAASTSPLAQVGELMNIDPGRGGRPDQARRRAARPPDLRRDRGAPPRRAPRASAATSSRCCCRRGPRRARR